MSSAYFKIKLINRHCNGSIIAASKKCRLCSEDGKIFYGDIVKFKDLYEILKQLCDIDCSKDRFPIRFCSGCLLFLQQAITFRSNVKRFERLHNKVKPVDTGTKSRIISGSFSDFSQKFERIGKLKSRSNHKTPSYCAKGRICYCVSSTSKLGTKIIPISKDPLKIYSCKKCKEMFVTKHDLNVHECEFNVLVKCSVCHRLITSTLFKRHMLRHQNTTHLVCDTCGKLFRKDNLLRHLKSHNFELPFQCPVCPYKGRFKESLAIHMRTHVGDKPFSCSQCKNRFLTKSNLNRHLLTHRKEKLFKCQECGRGFNTKIQSDSHFRSDHIGIKDYGCKSCNTKYGTKKSLMRHELRVHKREKLVKGRTPLYLQAEYRK